MDIDKYDLPLKNSQQLVETSPISHGAYQTTIEVNNKIAIKFLRLQRPTLEQDSVENNPHLPQPNGISTLLDIAHERQKDYNRLLPYIGKFLPKLIGISVVKTPSRLFYESKYQNLPPEVIDQFPLNESSVMEVWQNIHPENSLGRLTYDQLSYYCLSDSNFRLQMREFAQNTANLFFYKGIMIDICGPNGIRIKTNKSDYRAKGFEEITQIDDVFDIANGKTTTMAFPNNTTYTDQSLYFYDIFPLSKSKISEGYSKFLREIVEALSNNNPDSATDLLYELDSGTGRDGRRQAIYYIALLKNLGANFDRILHKEVSD